MNLDKVLMDLDQPVGYRPYDPDPRTATGIQDVATSLASAGYESLVEAVATRLAQHAAVKRARRVICLDLYQAPKMDLFLARFRSAWEAAHGEAVWMDTRTARVAPTDSSRLAMRKSKWLSATCAHDAIFPC